MKLTHWDKNTFSESEKDEIFDNIAKMRHDINGEPDPLKRLILLENFYIVLYDLDLKKILGGFKRS